MLKMLKKWYYIQLQKYHIRKAYKFMDYKSVRDYHVASFEFYFREEESLK